MRRAAWSRCWRAATSCTRSAAASPRTSRTWSNGDRLEVLDGAGLAFESEAEPRAEPAHAGIGRQDLRDDALHPPRAADLQQLFQQRAAQPAALYLVAHQQRELRVASPDQAREARHRDDLSA